MRRGESLAKHLRGIVHCLTKDARFCVQVHVRAQADDIEVGYAHVEDEAGGCVVRPPRGEKRIDR